LVTKNYNLKKLYRGLTNIEFTIKNMLNFSSDLSNEQGLMLFNAYENISKVGREIYLKIRETEKDFVGN
jgi:hypothetical protein